MISLAVLAGGKSERMGTDKALIPFMGKPLILWILERLSTFGDEAIVTTDQPADYAFLHFPVFPDLIPGSGPLGGLYTALNSSKNELVAAVACDMPFASPGLFKYASECIIRTGADVVIPSTPDGLEPLHAVYRRETCLPVIRSSLESGKRKLIAWLPEMQVRIISPEETIKFDPHGLAFWNLNTPEELTLAEERARSGNI